MSFHDYILQQDEKMFLIIPQSMEPKAWRNEMKFLAVSPLLQRVTEEEEEEEKGRRWNRFDRHSEIKSPVSRLNGARSGHKGCAAYQPPRVSKWLLCGPLNEARGCNHKLLITQLAP